MKSQFEQQRYRNTITTPKKYLLAHKIAQWLRQTIKKIRLVRKTQKSKYDPEWLEVAQVDERIQKRRYGTTQAVELAGISHSLLYAAEQDGRLPEPSIADTVKKVRSGYHESYQSYSPGVQYGSSKPEGASALVGILNLKGWRQLCHRFLSTCYEGLSRSLLDTDPQGSLSFFFGKDPTITLL